MLSNPEKWIAFSGTTLRTGEGPNEKATAVGETVVGRCAVGRCACRRIQSPKRDGWLAASGVYSRYPLQSVVHWPLVNEIGGL